MPVITKLSAQKKVKSRVNVHLDGKYSFSLSIDTVIEHELKINQEFTESEIITLIEESYFEKVMGKVLNFLSFRPRSEKEIKDRLYQYTKDSLASKELIKRCLIYCHDRNLINDLDFAKWFISQRQTHRPRSALKLKSELFAKGISNEIIDAALDELSFNEEDSLISELNKTKNQRLSQEKLIARLARLGYKYHDIRKAIIERE